MKIKTSELTGAALDWAVAEAEGNVNLQHDSLEGLIIHNVVGWIHYRPSTAWMHGGPIIEENKIAIYPYTDHLSENEEMVWVAGTPNVIGPTPLIAAMRCYVALKLGEEVEVPEGLHD